MPRFFTSSVDLPVCVIGGEDAAHIARSLRMHPGDAVTLCDGRGTDARGTLMTVSPESCSVSVLETFRSPSEADIRVTAFAALSKSDRMEYAVQKCVELGVYRFVPFLSERCVIRPEKGAAAKLERWRRIALEAAKQSGRGIIPEISEIMIFGDVIAASSEFDRTIFLYEGGCDFGLRDALGTGDFKSAAVITGPEGGFSDGEVSAAKNRGVRPVTMGARILRCETAPVAALAALMYHTGNL